MVDKELLRIGIPATLAIAKMVQFRFPLDLNQQIARSSDYPNFYVIEDKVYLTYGGDEDPWLIVDIRCSKRDFLDWAGTWNLLNKVIDGNGFEITTRVKEED